MENRKKAGRKKGFTILEMVFVGAVFVIFMMSIIKITMDGLTTYKRGINQSEMKQQLRRAMTALSNDIRQSVPTGGTSGWIQPTYTSGSTAAVTSMDFYRYTYNSANENTPGSGRVQYSLTPDPGTNPTQYKLERTETVNDVPRVSVLATNLEVDTGNPTNGSHFRWERSGLDNNVADLNTMVIKLVMKRYHGTIPERIDLETKVSLRSEQLTYSGTTRVYWQSSVYLDLPSSLSDPRD